MKSLITLCLILTISVASFAQASTKPGAGPLKENSPNNSTNQPTYYRLFATQNIWTFIKLDTRNGQMWQVQFDIKDTNRVQNILSSIPLVNKEDERPDRFTLYPTQNIYNFMLLDQVDGRVWQVQWSLNPENRGIIRIPD